MSKACFILHPQRVFNMIIRRIAALLFLSAVIGTAQPAGDQIEPKKNIKVDALGDPLPTGVLARMGSVRFRHGAQLQMLQYSKDGKVHASLGVDGSIRIWDTESGAE